MSKKPAASRKKPGKTAPSRKHQQPSEAAAAAATPKAPPVELTARFGERAPVPNAFHITKEAALVLWRNWRIFLGIVLIYLVLNLLLVQGLRSSSNVVDLKNSLDHMPTNGAGKVANGVSLVTTLIGASGTNVSPVAGPYQFVMVLVVSLAVIWLLRELYASREVTMRDGFYRGMYPFVTFSLVLGMIILQLLPFAIGASLYSIAVSNGITSGVPEQLIFLAIFLSLSFASLYMLCSSLFALYIVALPNTTPWAALRSARDLVAHRRWIIMRKVLLLPVLLLVGCTVLMLPFVLLLPLAAPWAFVAVMAAMLVFGHSYMYALYRSLL